MIYARHQSLSLANARQKFHVSINSKRLASLELADSSSSKL